ncbi:MAG TPA: hypothetical protein VIO94_08475 [Phenylobacterium sp.]
MDALTGGQLRVLQNLADKRSGTMTSFINIADAQHLTELGLATRSRQGWDITTAGSAFLAGIDAAAIDDGSVVQLHARSERDEGDEA